MTGRRGQPAATLAVPKPPSGSRRWPFGISHSAMSIYLFGCMSFCFGVLTLLRPEQAAARLELPSEAIPAIQACSLAAIAIGVFYTLAAYQENRAFFRCSLLTRSLTTWVLWNASKEWGSAWKEVALWEGTAAAVTAVALVWDWWLK
ncbi:uncharacterized protein EI97DRAFT_124696 [Westerdykella ornata]|uniref:Uncharacterized protein n=1 Tax=Westerdykella ornata TaxID=318751 RepID=A0A6A6JXG5_WESOR|nr:uncharacterized protein EI97DRAFT_124696 [Westerdykella ornata]KAF2280508.1 hypothetical protein EI97DRAFT_124696 [Westerdykella ornata]